MYMRWLCFAVRLERVSNSGYLRLACHRCILLAGPRMLSDLLRHRAYYVGLGKRSPLIKALILASVVDLARAQAFGRLRWWARSGGCSCKLATSR